MLRNFNEKTSTIYGDHALFTKHKGMTQEANAIFEFLEDFRKRFDFDHLLVAPDHMRSDLYQLIDGELKIDVHHSSFPYQMPK